MQNFLKRRKPGVDNFVINMNLSFSTNQRKIVDVVNALRVISDIAFNQPNHQHFWAVEVFRAIKKVVLPAVCIYLAFFYFEATIL